MRATVRHFTPQGRMIVVGGIAALAFLALAMLILVPSKFGFGGW